MRSPTHTPDIGVGIHQPPFDDSYNFAVQFKQAGVAKPQNFRFKLETHTCAGCQRAEYACTCDE